MAECEEELKSLLMKMTEKSEKAGLKLNIQNPKIMISGQAHYFIAHRRKLQQWQTLFSGAPKSQHMVTAAMKLKDAYSLEGKL